MGTIKHVIENRGKRDKSTAKVKVFFKLTIDEYGYPPYERESLWCIPEKGQNYIVDNVPFFVYGIALGDVIKTDLQKNYLFVERFSGNKTIRIYVENKSFREKIKTHLIDCECVIEQSNLASLIAVGVPKHSISRVISLLDDNLKDGLEYEVAN